MQNLIAALDRADVGWECPICSHTSWTPLYDVAGIPASNSPIGSSSYRALAIACERCGFIRFHLASVLDQHIDPRNI